MTMAGKGKPTQTAMAPRPPRFGNMSGGKKGGGKGGGKKC